MKTLRVDLAFFLAFFLAWTVCVKIFWYSPVNGLLETGLGHTETGLLLRAINVGVWLGFAALYLRATDRQDPLSYLKLRHNVARGLVVGALVGSAFLVKDFARVWLIDDRAPDLSGLSPASFLSSFAEEVVFRGLVLQQAAQYTTFWKANALSALLFVAIHLPGWIFEGLPSIAGLLSSAAFIFGLALLLGYLLKKTRSLWACAVTHALSNWGATF